MVRRMRESKKTPPDTGTVVAAVAGRMSIGPCLLVALDAPP